MKEILIFVATFFYEKHYKTSHYYFYNKAK